MSAPRFEIVRTDAGFHSRFRAKNSRIVWVTESYKSRRAALDALWHWGKARYQPEVPWSLGVLTAQHGAIEVREIDERTPAPEPATVEPPFYLTHSLGAPYWHDRDRHWRHCYGDECEEGTPPIGTPVAGRFGVVLYDGEATS